MLKSVAVAVIFCLSVLQAGCSSAPLITIPPDWRSAKDAISLHIKADPQLNLFQKNSHALLLCIYHLRDPNAFNQLLDERDGLQKLLECGRFDPSVVHVRRMLIQPGQEISESLDRAEGVKLLNVVAGYYNLHKERVTASFQVPLSEERRGGNLVQIPNKLVIDLRLGPQELQKVPQQQNVQEKK